MATFCLRWPPFVHLSILLLCLISCRLTSTNLLSDDAAVVCDLSPCDRLHSLVKEKFVTKYNSTNSIARNLNMTIAQARCAGQRTYGACLDGLSCHGSIEYHGMRSLQVKRMEELGCRKEGYVYSPHTPPPPAPLCSFNPNRNKGDPTLRLCSLFGDPHLRTFDGRFATCRIVGAWPLIDNEFLTVQVSNRALTKGGPDAVSASTRATVIVHNIDDECGPPEAVYYRATSTHLPDSFVGGKKEYGRGRAVRLTSDPANKRIEIHLKYINATVSVKQAAGYLVVSVTIPQVFLNRTLNPAGVPAGGVGEPRTQQLCMDGCLPGQTIDHPATLARATYSHPADVRRAVDACRKHDLTDFFLDACVFDAVTTGGFDFTSAAIAALDDLKRFRPNEWLLVSQRTSLVQGKHVTSRPPSHPSSSSAQLTVSGVCWKGGFVIVLVSSMLSQWWLHFLLMGGWTL